MSKFEDLSAPFICLLFSLKEIVVKSQDTIAVQSLRSRYPEIFEEAAIEFYEQMKNINKQMKIKYDIGDLPSIEGSQITKH